MSSNEQMNISIKSQSANEMLVRWRLPRIVAIPNDCMWHTQHNLRVGVHACVLSDGIARDGVRLSERR